MLYLYLDESENFILKARVCSGMKPIYFTNKEVTQ